MKQMAGIAIRLTLAIVGLGLIAGLLIYTWHGQVVLPAGYGDLDEPQRRIAIASVQELADGSRRYHLDPASGIASLTDADFGPDDDTPTRIPGPVEVLAMAHVGLVLLGLALFALAYPLQAGRWLLLMRCRGMAVGYAKALQLTLVGQFFSVFLPGATGGDLAKAYYVASGSGARARAVISVVADRVCGLIGLVLLVGLLGLAQLDHPLVRSVVIGAWVGLCLLMLAGALYASPRMRRALRVGSWFERLPGQSAWRSLDGAAVAYREHRMALLGAVAISLVVHMMLAAAATMAGLGVGVDVGALLLLVLFPVVLFFGSIPVMPSGLGVMEGAAVLLFDAPIAHLMGMMLLFRLYQLSMALLGGALTFRGRLHVHPVPTPTASGDVHPPPRP